MDIDETAERVRPGPLRWIRYAYGAGLPERYRTWVLHDVTARTWVLRHAIRSIVQFLPFAVVILLVVPVDRTMLVTGIAMGNLIGLLFSTAFVDNAAESRAMKAGYPEGYATEVRRRRRARNARAGVRAPPAIKRRRSVVPCAGQVAVGDLHAVVQHRRARETRATGRRAHGARARSTTARSSRLPIPGRR